VTTSGRQIRVLIAEDNFFTRFGTVAFLQLQPDIEVVGAAPDGQRALELYDQLRPDVVLIDLRMPRVDGVTLAASLRTRTPDPRILVLTNYAGDEDVFQALKAGARGYLTKESSGDELANAVRALHAGQRVLPAEIAQQLSRRCTLPELTRREREVLEQVAEGASNREVGQTLRISERTVGLFVSRILSKLDACSRTEAVSIGVKRGLLPFRQR
jgi:two-component system NarL family response regulator